LCVWWGLKKTNGRWRDAVEERIMLRLCCGSVAALLQLYGSCSMLEVARRSGREDAVAALLQLCCSSVAALLQLLHAGCMLEVARRSRSEDG
jgi:hypothetical protein